MVSIRTCTEVAIKLVACTFRENPSRADGFGTVALIGSHSESSGSRIDIAVS